MISVLLYGRNDSHGYNLHRRAALSLNCIAEVLTDAGDEIIFVDYNTPDGLPTFIEAIADTLTDACLDRLRVLRVPAAIHQERFASRTHLPAVEPVARNAAARRSNPSNRWLLSTNTDMIFVPLADRSLSETCERLADGFYGLPRFELPEWLWEALPRSDPRRAMTEVKCWGPRLCLDEPTLSTDWIRFDAPGDFHLILRDEFFAIHGYDEEMLLGWHVDSNLSRRMFLRRGAIESVGDHVAGYHCNHNRLPTVYHGPRVVLNDSDRFIRSIEQPELPEQRGSWGLNGTELEEVPLGRTGQELAETVARAIGDDPGQREMSDARKSSTLTYDSAHVLPFAADALALSPPKTTIAYLGMNSVLELMLSALVTDLGRQRHFVVAQLEEEGSLAALDQAADLFVIDLGVDRSLLGEELEIGSPRMPPGLVLVYEAFERLVELERARIRIGAHPRRFVLLNSKNILWDTYVLAQLDCTYETHHSRVRSATVKDSPLAGDRESEDADRTRRLLRFCARPSGRLVLRPGEHVRVATLDDHRGFGDGWSLPDQRGIWTEGPRASLAVALDGSFDDPSLALSIGRVCVSADDPLEVDLLVNGEHVATRRFDEPDRQHTWQFSLPSNALLSRTAEVTLVVHDPRSPSSVGWWLDDRPLGLHLRAVTFGSVPVTARVVESLIGFRRHLYRLRAGQR